MNKNRILFVSIFVALFIIVLLFPYKTETVKTYKHINKSTIDKLEKEDNIEQLFVSDGNYDYIGFFYANYGKLIKKGHIFINIENERGKAKEYKIKAKSLFDNSSFYIKYKLKKGKKYKVSINNNTGKDVTFYTTEEKLKNNKLYRNGELQPNNLILSFKKNKTSYKTIWYYMMFLTIVLMIITLKEEKVKK